MGKEDAIPANRNEAIRLLEEIITGLRNGTVALDGNRPIEINRVYVGGHTENDLRIRYYQAG